MDEKKVFIREIDKILEIYNYSVSIDGSGYLEIADVSGQDAHICNSLDPHGQARIKIDSLNEIVFNNCSVQCVSNFNLGSKLSFNNCNIPNGIILGYGSNFNRISVSGRENSYVKFTRHEALEVKNSDITIDHNGKLTKIETVENEEITVGLSAVSVAAITGHVKSLKIYSNAHFDIQTTTNCKIDEFISADNFEAYGLCLHDRNIFIRQEPDTVKLEGIEIDKLVIKNIFLKLNIKDVNLYNTEINFEGDRSGLDVTELFTAATVWNPFRICYRGFCPRRKIEKSLKKTEVLAAQEFFSGMKKYFSDKGNSVTASYFYAAEMEAHRIYLQKQYPWKLYLPWKNIHHERFISFISKISSNYSQNWFLAFCWYVFIGAAFASFFYVIGEKKIDVIYNADVYVTYAAHIYSPLTVKFDEITKQLLMPGYANFLWLLWKIIAGYLIYQMVVSSRKFVRF